jgi:predicted transcriptional regulator
MGILKENDVLFAHKVLNIMSGVSDATRRVAGAIIDHFNKRTGQCDPSIERLATMLGINRATVIRATETLHERDLIEKSSHGGKSHRASYLPNWTRFRDIVEDWDARMKIGEGPGKSPDTPESSTASVRRIRLQGRDVIGRKDATLKVASLRHKPIEETNRKNQSNKPLEAERAENTQQKPQPQSRLKAQQGLLKENKPMAKRSLPVPTSRDSRLHHGEAARLSAERRWNKAASKLCEKDYAAVLDWMTPDRQEAVTQAELARKGGGLDYIFSALRSTGTLAYG